MLTSDELNHLIVQPTEIYHGRSYGGIAEEFMQWLVQYNPDNQSLRDIYFLRGVDFEGYKGNLDHRFVRIGNEALQVYTDQAICCPVIVCFGDNIIHNLDTPAKRRDAVNNWLQEGDDPPQYYQISIDGLHPHIDWKDFKVITKDFIVQIPEPVDGHTLGQILDVPLDRPGPSEFVVGGYFLVLKPFPEGKHYISYFAVGDNDYRNQTFVELNVMPRGKIPRKSVLLQSEINSILSSIDTKINANESINEKELYDSIISLSGSFEQEVELEEIKKRRAHKRLIEEQEFNKKLSEVDKLGSSQIQSSTLIYGPNEEPNGLPYEEHAKNYWKWQVSTPKDENPESDTTGEKCCSGQDPDSSIFYLSIGPNVPYLIHRKCEIKHGKDILIPVMTVIVTDGEVSEFPNPTTEDFRKKAKHDQDSVTHMKLRIDQQIYPMGQLMNYRLQDATDEFTVKFPDNGLWGVSPGDHKAVADGHYIIAKSLSKGEHTIHWESRLDCIDQSGPGKPKCFDAIFRQNIKYTITIT